MFFIGLFVGIILCFIYMLFITDEVKHFIYFIFSKKDKEYKIIRNKKYMYRLRGDAILIYSINDEGIVVDKWKRNSFIFNLVIDFF